MELPRSWWIRQSRTRAKKRRRGAWTSVGRASGPEPRGRLSLSWTGSVGVRYQYLTVCLLSLSLSLSQEDRTKRENPEALGEISHCTALEMASSRYVTIPPSEPCMSTACCCRFFQVYAAFILSLQPVSLQRLLSVSQMFSPVWHVGFLWATPPTHRPLPRPRYFP